MPAAKKSSEDPVEKLARMIDEKLKSAFDERDTRDRESKDPWARIEGMIERGIGKALTKREEASAKPKAEDEGPGEDEGEQRRSPLEVLGLK
jgi:hypothetical protein